MDTQCGPIHRNKLAVPGLTRESDPKMVDESQLELVDLSLWLRETLRYL